MTRMAAQKVAYIPASSGLVKECRCPDGLTTLPYIVLGKLSVRPKRCNFVVVHDFFDTLDATSLMVKQVTQRHDGCQALCFNYPGQVTRHVTTRHCTTQTNLSSPFPVLQLPSLSGVHKVAGAVLDRKGPRGHRAAAQLRLAR